MGLIIVRSLRSRVGLYFPPETITITTITCTQILQLRTLAQALLVSYSNALSILKEAIIFIYNIVMIYKPSKLVFENCIYEVLHV